ncbi:UTP--glucose-1-phosphate uridylyltransferase [Iodidimonas nitroreducens]|uniref:UTP--glucose-1-phosphate uridylyltransferase n=1 Tax=Iodidimonas nitroreducens TaxID=1236968 RepID=A0A5A7N887_9PROT|nr:UTP--glucose-1-phosphate uridylyltransferase GalU [Iodidimonas nitroreducens]GAK33837.1 UTP--glucose-1-phosphate uridylyltransferase 1 [alpha proteobacterium Q-1]GER03279.1 UTP--glucose-1-phosphate uridylyltransferase [Iodidimonas nitroreducens]
MKAKVRKAVMPVAGLGTRFLPATKAMPKEMLPVVDKPIIQYAVEEAFAAGIEEIIFVTGRGKYLLEDHFDHAFELEATLAERGKDEALEIVQSIIPKAGGVSYTRQQKPLGLGHAVWCARNLVGDEPFAVLLPDDLVQAQVPCLKQMMEAYEEKGGNLLAVMDVPRDQTQRYGIVDADQNDGDLVTVKGLVEKPLPADAPSTLSIIGRYILQPQLFDALARKERGAGGEIQLTDAMVHLIGQQPFHGFRFSGTRYDCGDKLGFLKATVAMALERDDLGSEFADYLKSLSI